MQKELKERVEKKPLSDPELRQRVGTLARGEGLTYASTRILSSVQAAPPMGVYDVDYLSRNNQLKEYHNLSSYRPNYQGTIT